MRAVCDQVLLTERLALNESSDTCYAKEHATKEHATTKCCKLY